MLITSLEFLPCPAASPVLERRRTSQSKNCLKFAITFKKLAATLSNSIRTTRGDKFSEPPEVFAKTRLFANKMRRKERNLQRGRCSSSLTLVLRGASPARINRERSRKYTHSLAAYSPNSLRKLGACPNFFIERSRGDLDAAVLKIA